MNFFCFVFVYNDDDATNSPSTNIKDSQKINLYPRYRLSSDANSFLVKSFTVEALLLFQIES